MLSEFSDIEILEKTTISYVKYIDCRYDLGEEERSNILMEARELHIEADARGLNVGKLF